MSILSTLFGANAQESSNIKIIDAETFKEAITANKVQLVDVRAPSEFSEGTIEGSINIDYFQQENFRSEFEKLDKNEPVYLYCRSGNRSQKAAAILVEMGFEQIVDLKGGYMGWPYKN